MGKTQYDPRFNTLQGADPWTGYIIMAGGAAIIAYFAWISFGPDRNKPF
jgi:hypothetical protein